MKFSSSAARALHPTFFSSHPDDNEFYVDVIPPFIMDSSYSQDDGADDLPPASIPAAAVDHIVNCNDSNDKEIVIVDSNYGLSHCSVGCCLMEAAEGQSHLAQTRTLKQLKQRCPTRLLLSPSLLLQLLPKDLLIKKT